MSLKEQPVVFQGMRKAGYEHWGNVETKLKTEGGLQKGDRW